MAGSRVGRIDWNAGNIAEPWFKYLKYIILTSMPIDEDPVLKSIPRWTAVQQPEAELVPRFACLDPSLPGRILDGLQALLTDPSALSIAGNPLWNSDIPDILATSLDHLSQAIGMAGRGLTGKPVTTTIRATISEVALVALRGIAVAFDLVLDRDSSGDSTRPNSWWNDWTIKYGEHVALIGQDHSFDFLRDMEDLQSGVVLESSSTQEGLPAVIVQVGIDLILRSGFGYDECLMQLGHRMLSAKVRFALLFSTVAFRLVEIGKHLERPFHHLLIEVPDSRLEQGHVLLVSPAYWLSSVPPQGFGMLSLETKPVLALLTAMVLAGLRDPVIHPVSCDIESLGQGLSNAIRDGMRPSETEYIPRGGASGEQVRRHHITPQAVSELSQVLAFSYETTGISSTSRVLRRTRVQQHQQGFTPQPLITPLPNSSPDLPDTRAACPALGTLPNPPGLPEPRHSLVLHEHVPYAGCLEAWRGTLDQSKRVLAKLFLREHVESAHCEAYAYERFLSVPDIEGVIVPRYWGTYTYRGEFYVIVLEDTGRKLKSFRDCNPKQRYDFRHYVRHLP